MRRVLSIVLAIFFVLSGQFALANDDLVKGRVDKNDIIKKCVIERKNVIMYAVLSPNKSPILVDVTGYEELASKNLLYGGEVLMIHCILTYPSGAQVPEWKNTENDPGEKNLELRTVKLDGNKSSELDILPKNIKVWTTQSPPPNEEPSEVHKMDD